MSGELLRVLVVGVSTMLTAIEAWLAANGKCQVRAVSGADEALELVPSAEEPFDLAIIDLEACERSSTSSQSPIELIRFLRDSSVDTAVVILADNTVERDLDLPCEDSLWTLDTPVNLEALALILRSAREFRQLKRAIQEKEIIERIFKATDSAVPKQNQADVFDCILKGMCAAGFDRARLYLFLKDEMALIGKSHVGMDHDFDEIRWGLSSLVYEQLTSNTRPHVINPTSGELAREPSLQKEITAEIALVPLLSGNKLIGVVFADNKPSNRRIAQRTLASIALFANQWGKAIESSLVIEGIKQKADQLESLRQTTLAITVSLDRESLLNIIIEQAIRLLNANNGGIYKYDPSAQNLTVICDYKRPMHVGKTIKLGEGMAGELVESEEPFNIIDDYSSWQGRAAVFAEHCPYGAVLEVPLKWLGRIIGVIYVDDEVGRTFTSEDARLLGLFAEQAAIAIVYAEIMAEDENKLKRLESLSQASKEIIGNLGSTTVDERLTLIARHVTEILGAEVSSVLLADKEGNLSLEASYGKGTFKKGTKFKFASGLIGHIAHERRMFNAQGKDLANYFAVHGEGPPHLPSGKSHSLLVIPLLSKSKAGNHLIGLLCAENKQGSDSGTYPGLKFSKEDAWVLNIFAEAVVVALEGLALIQQLSDQMSHSEALISSSPTGIVANDRNGLITQFNFRAEQLLGYTAKEVLHTPVKQLFVNPEGPRKIGKQIHLAPKGRLANYETLIKSRSGDAIPIRVSATWVKGSGGNVRRGAVGYFEDLRFIKEGERRLELLLSANTIVAEAKNLTEGLQRLVQMMASVLPHTFCRLLLIDDRRQLLTVKAAYLSPAHQSVVSNLEQPLKLEDWPGLLDRIATYPPTILRWADNNIQPVLERLSRTLKLETHIESLLVVPLRLGTKVVGLLEFGELQSEEERPFTPEEINIVSDIATKTTILIERMRLYDLAERNEQLLKALNEASLHIRADRGTATLLQEVVRLAAELVRFTSGGLFICESSFQELELRATFGLNQEICGSRMKYSDGLIGLVAQTGKPQIDRNYIQERDPILGSFGLQTLVAVPLRNDAGEVEAVLFVADDHDEQQEQRFLDTDIEVLEHFAEQASIALQTSRLLTREQRIFNQLRTVNKISNYVQEEQDLDNLLHVVLTGVTADYGLRLNRAALFLLDDRGNTLLGQMGIGHVDEVKARADWKQDNQTGIRDLAHYLELIAQKPFKLTPIGERVKKLQLSVDPKSTDVLSRALNEQQNIALKPSDLAALPEEFRKAFEPDLPCVVIPLETHNEAIGLLFADNKFTQAPITDEDVHLLRTLANTAAIAIENRRLLKQAQMGRDKLRSLYEASTALTSGKNPREVLQDIVRQTAVAAGAAWVRVILINETGQPWEQYLGGTQQQFGLTEMVRKDGITMQVMKSGRVEKIEDADQEKDRINPFIPNHGIKAALCFPFSLRERPIGVMWINYYEPRHFPDTEIKALQLYVNQAAIAYESARRMEELEHLNKAALAIAEALRHPQEDRTITIIEQVNRAIVEQAAQMLRADAATIWPFVKDKFLPNELAAVGIGEGELQLFRELEPTPDGTTFTVLKEGWVGVEDIQNPEYTYLTARMREHLQSAGLNAFQGVALKVGDEPVGVLYVSYKQPHTFGDDEKRSLANLGNYAALFLNNARSLDQVEQAKRAAEVVAAVTVLEDRDATLRSVANGTLKAVDCDAVVLYAYDQAKGTWIYPPTNAGVWHADKAWPNDQVPPTSIVYQIFNREEPYIAERVASDPLLGGRFAKEEQIESCVALPLRAGRNVGVMFVNYRAMPEGGRKLLTSYGLSNIKLFANQAAVAIRNAQLFEERLREQETLVGLSKELLGTLSLKQTLDSAVHVASRVLDTEFCNIVLSDKDGALVFAAAVGWDPKLVGDFHPPPGTGSQTGYTMTQDSCVIVDDYEVEDRFTVLDLIREQEIKSGMSVPMFRGSEKVGAMLVHSKSPRHFNEVEANLLSLIANQTAIAIERAEQYEADQRKSASLSALYAAGKAITTASLGLGLRRILDQIVKQATLIDWQRGKIVFASIQLYDEETLELVFESVHRPEVFPELVQRFGERTSLKRDEQKGARMGITGRAVLTKVAQRVVDVAQDPDYLVFNPTTRSELAVPLFDRDEVVGVLNVESDQPGAFDHEDERTLLALAELAVIAIQNARQHAALKQLKGQVGARTALAWMGMTSSTWWHGVRADANTIVNAINLVRDDLSNNGDVKSQAIEERLGRIENLAKKIRMRNITPPLSAEEGVESIPIENLIKERLDQLWKQEPYLGVERLDDLPPVNHDKVRASPAWLRRALDILVDNAIDAMLLPHPVTRPQLAISSSRRKGRAEILISDNGRGIPDAVIPKLFCEVIENGKGMGMGLLLAQAIIQTYGGEVELRSTCHQGTTIAIWLPLEPVEAS